MDLNRVTLIGTLGKDPVYHDMSTGGELCKFSMATSRRWSDKQTGEKREDTSWHQIVIFDKFIVKAARRFLQKGTKVFIEGELKTRDYDKDGEKRYVTEVTVPSFSGKMIILSRGKGWDVNETPGSDRVPGSGTTGGEPAKINPDDFDDDIPF